jgi:hypothetical protein
MTEAEGDDVGSVCKLLAPLMALPEHVATMRLFAADRSAHLATVSLALMAEAASRGARAAVATYANKTRRRAAQVDAKGTPLGATALSVDDMADAAHALLVKAFVVAPHSVVQPLSDDVSEPKVVTHAADYDHAHALAASGAFFGKAWPTNTSLPAVMAALTFARALSMFVGDAAAVDWDAVDTTALADHVLHAFDSASMATFFADFVRVPLPASAADYQVRACWVARSLRSFRQLIIELSNNARLLFMYKVCGAV